jgi:hypothetical protein
MGVKDEVIVVLAMLLLLPGTGSVTPSGGVTVAELINAPTIPAGTVPVTLNVALVPAGSVTSASMLPAPAGEPHDAPTPLGVHVQPNPASGAGSASCTRALLTFDGPALLTTTV